MNRKATDPQLFMPGSNVEALVQNQTAADNARAKIGEDAALREAVQSFEAEGTLPPYLPQAGARVEAVVAPAPQPATPPPSPAPPVVESSVILAPQVFEEPVQAPKPGPKSDVLIALPQAAPNKTTKKLKRPPGATGYLNADGAFNTDLLLDEQTGDGVEQPAPLPPRRGWIAGTIALAFLCVGFVCLWQLTGIVNPANSPEARASAARAAAELQLNSVNNLNRIPKASPPPLPITPVVEATAEPTATQVVTSVPAPSEQATHPQTPNTSTAKSATAPTVMVPTAAPTASAGSGAWKPNW